MTSLSPREKGFTIIELLMVIAIISLIASIVLAVMNEGRKKARDARRYSDIQEINKAIQLYISDHNHAPYLNGQCSETDDGTDSSCNVVDYNWGPLATELSPYLSSMPRDPCGQSCPDASVGEDTYWFTYEYVSPAVVAELTGNQDPYAYKIYAQNLETNLGEKYGFNLTY